MTSAAVSPISAAPQLEPANFLNLLIVDDERAIREACREVAVSLGFSTYMADSAEQAARALESQNFDAVLLDLRLPGAGGLDALRKIKERRPEAVVVVVTGYGTVQSAVQAMKHGAYDYVTKPFSVDELKLLLERVGSHLKLKSENRILREKVKSKQGYGGIVGRAPEMERLYRIIAKAANSVHPVLILGESGTGKEMVARSIHYSGPFRDKPFIPVDCGSLVPTLIESELFGYVKGAFTGANQSKDGLLAMAEGGLFSSTRWENSLSICRRRCCGRSRRKKFAPLEARDAYRSMCEFLRRRIAIWSRRSCREVSGAICISASTCSACASQHCASDGRTFLC
jgi:DNA-binding NtrC family response regulator